MHEKAVVLFIQILLVVVMILMVVIVARTYLMRKKPIFERFGLGMLIGFFTDFGDTLGIGSFATTTAAFRATHFVQDDRQLPGTLKVGVDNKKMAAGQGITRITDITTIYCLSPPRDRFCYT